MDWHQMHHVKRSCQLGIPPMNERGARCGGGAGHFSTSYIGRRDHELENKTNLRPARRCQGFFDQEG